MNVLKKIFSFFSMTQIMLGWCLLFLVFLGVACSAHQIYRELIKYVEVSACDFVGTYLMEAWFVYLIAAILIPVFSCARAKHDKFKPFRFLMIALPLLFYGFWALLFMAVDAC